MPKKTAAPSKAHAIADIALGKAKRVAGELTGRPDLVLDGEAQETDGLRERKRADKVP